MRNSFLRCILFITVSFCAMVIPTKSATAGTRYVSLSGGDVWPYTNWATAATTIQSAVNASGAGDTIVVTDGVYNVGTTLTPGHSLPNRLVATNAVVIQSVNGPTVTIIQGAGPRGTGAVRVAYLSGGANLEGFTIEQGATFVSGNFPYDVNAGGVYIEASGSISNCIVQGNDGLEGGGMYIRNGGFATDCVIENNVADNGAGVRMTDAGSGSVRNSRIVGNVARVAGGVLIYHSGRLQNCLIADNVATQRAGAVYVDWGSQGAYIENCTIAGNSAPVSGGLDYVINGAYVRNSIIYGNVNGNWSGGSYTYSLTTPQPGGTGNQSADPQFADAAYRLGAGSPAINAGANNLAVGSLDVDGNARIVGGTVDLGAYEFAVGGSEVTAPLAPVGPSTGMVQEVLAYTTSGSVCSEEGGVEYRYDWGDGTISAWGDATQTHAWQNTGMFYVRAQARCFSNAVVVSGWSSSVQVSIDAIPYTPGTRYVSLSGGNVWPYTNWATAATTIQSAVNASGAGDTIVVTDGVYNVGTTLTPGHSLPNRLVATNAVVIQSVNGPTVTIIQGAGPRGTGAVRVAYLSGGANLEGFTIEQGATFVSGNFPYDVNAGGVYIEASGSISNCIVQGNDGLEGGGMYIRNGGFATDCVIENNVADNGAGVRMTDAGSGSVRNSRIVGNVARVAGGVLIYHSGRLQNCLIADNVATQRAGAVYVDWGSQGAYIENCTIAGNSAPVSGGLDYVINGAYVRNSIIYGNVNGNWSGGSYTYSLTTPQPGGTGNQSADPQFADAAYRLGAGSPAINAGANNLAVGSLDVDGNARIVGGTVDLGAYEFAVGGSEVTAPLAPVGPSTGMVQEVLAYTTSGSVCSEEGGVEYRYDWGDGTISAWGDATQTHTWQITGMFYVRAQARCIANPSVLSTWSSVKSIVVSKPPVVPTIHYVSIIGTPVSPYTNWATAARTIQDAIHVCNDDDTVLVAEGIYNENLVIEGKRITLASQFVNDGDRAYIENTIIDGGASNRVVTYQNIQGLAGRMVGFTITNGHAKGTTFPNFHGGGIACIEASPSLEHLVVSGNEANEEGGGLYVQNASPSVRNVEFKGNRAYQGGAIRLTYSDPDLINIVMDGNDGRAGAGAIAYYHSNGRLRNALVINNTADGDGAAMFFDASSPRLENITMAGNLTTNGVGGAMNISYLSHPVLMNSIVWGNGSNPIIFHTRWYGMALTVESSDLEGGLAGIQTYDLGPVNGLGNNLEVDPVFVSPGNYRLSTLSPCNNSGTNQAWMLIESDIADSDRILDGIVNLGAYEEAATFIPQDRGTLSCVIDPDASVLMGAGWKVQGGGTWLNSGDVMSVVTGLSTVVFRDIPGWITPDAVEVYVHKGETEMVKATYVSAVGDATAPVIVRIAPPDGHVSASSFVPMTILVSDDSDVARVTVNGQLAEPAGTNTYHYTLTGIRGSYNPVTVQAIDDMGNSSEVTLNYGQRGHISLAALWDGNWKIMNPRTEDLPFTWTVEGSSEYGTGTLGSNRVAYFSTSLGPKLVHLYVDGVLVDSQASSLLSAPENLAEESDLDSDLDGYSNREEDNAGTDPNNSDDMLDVRMITEPSTPTVMSLGRNPTSLNTSPSSALVFEWTGNEDIQYSAETSTNLTQWLVSPAYENVVGLNGPMTYTGQVSSALMQYIRIKAEKRP